MKELGAGSSEWIVNQARANPDADYVSVELRIRENYLEQN